MPPWELNLNNNVLTTEGSKWIPKTCCNVCSNADSVIRPLLEGSAILILFRISIILPFWFLIKLISFFIIFSAFLHCKEMPCSTI